MNKQFAKLKVYELGSGVAFAEQTATVPFLVLPKGQATMKPWGASGFVFENVITGDVIAFVDTLDDVLDSAGVVYGITQIAVMTAVSAFFFLSSDIAAVDVTYDNAVSGLAAIDVQAAIDELATNANTNFELIPSKHNFQTFVGPSVIVQQPENNFVEYGIYILEETTISELTIEVTNAAAAATKFVIGIYNNSGGMASTKIVQSAEFAGDLVAVQTSAFAPITINKGLYFICVMSNAANMFVRAMQYGNPVFGFTIPNSQPRTQGRVGVGYAYNPVMPANAPIVDTFSSPAIANILLTTV